jgi:hypothetical protein
LGLLDRFKKKEKVEEAVIVNLNGTELGREIYRAHDLSTLEDQLISVLDGDSVGTFDGNELGSEGATLYLYGPDAHRLYAKIEPVLRTSPLCRNARVIVRQGGPGALQVEIQL